MSEVIPTNRGKSCAICQEKFRCGDKQVTHVGGEGHDGFHKSRRPNCPLDRQSIDPNSLITRTDWISGKAQASSS